VEESKDLKFCEELKSSVKHGKNKTRVLSLSCASEIQTETSRKTDLYQKSKPCKTGLKKLFSLDHLVELEHITFHYEDISLEVDTAFIPCLDFTNIEWSDFQIRDFS